MIFRSSHFRIEFTPDRCAAPGLSAETILATFSRTCYEFHVTRGESYDKAQQVCKSHGKSIEDDLNLNKHTFCVSWQLCTCQRIPLNGKRFRFLGGDLIHDFRGPTKDYILSELERRKDELRTKLVWIGAQKEPGFTSRVWKWVNGMPEKKTINKYVCPFFSR